MTTKNTGKQKCVHCTEKSLPGLKRGQGLCAYHFTEYGYGTAWAKKCHPSRAKGEQ